MHYTEAPFGVLPCLGSINQPQTHGTWEVGSMDKGAYGRKDRMVKTKRHDVYRERKKWPEPTRCVSCGAVFVKGRWTWETAAPDANEAVCPACRRVADHYPAGQVTLRGPFFEAHREELMNLLHNVEAQEKGGHPLERIMTLQEHDDHTEVTTTGIHLARRMGDALFRAYEGDLSVDYGDGEKSVRVQWQR